jgi:hypothetical protein
MIRDLAVDISAAVNENVISSLAWRVVAKKWLKKQPDYDQEGRKSVTQYYFSFLS